MLASAPLTFDPSQARVEAMMEQGTSFSDVEDAIDIAELTTEHKAALWLFAWSLRNHVEQRQEARFLLAAISADGWGSR